MIHHPCYGCYFFMTEWWDLQFNIDSQWKFEKLLIEFSVLLEIYRRKNFFILIFFSVGHVWPGIWTWTLCMIECMIYLYLINYLLFIFKNRNILNFSSQNQIIWNRISNFLPIIIWWHLGFPFLCFRFFQFNYLSLMERENKSVTKDFKVYPIN